jgi:hypothetical protein
MTKFQAGIIGAIVVASVLTPLVIQQQAQVKLREANQSLRQQIAQLKADNKSLSNRVIHVKDTRAPLLPAPPMPVTNPPSASPTENLQPTNLYARFKDKAPKLTAGQVEAYLKANGRKASSLLAAYRTSGDPALLKEAMEEYPNDPQVAFEAVFAKDLSPEGQRQWLNTFEQSAPDNALANYLSAFNYFNSGQMDQGIQELAAAAGKQLDDYTLNRVQDNEEAYLSAGYSPAEAERIADSSLMMSQLGQVKQLGRDLIALSNAYIQSGDQASAQATLQMAMNLGQTVASGSSSMALISQLTGISIETLALNAMNPNSPYGENGQTVQDQINQISQNRAAISELVRQATPLLPTMSDQDMLNYENRRRAFGELAALQWVVSKYGQQ